MKCLLLIIVSALASQSAGDEIVRCTSGAANIPDGSSAGVVFPFQVAEGETDQVILAERVDLEVAHLWIGDIVVRLTAPDGSVSTELLSRTGNVAAGFPGPTGCRGDDATDVLEDGAALSVEEVCTIGVQPVLAGSLRPYQSFAAVVGLNPACTWTLQVSDRQPDDVGQFMSACLRFEVAEDCNGDGVPDECTCIGDINGDQVINGADLAELLGVWGSASESGDLDGSGSVDGSDLTLMLAGWGVCS